MNYIKKYMPPVLFAILMLCITNYAWLDSGNQDIINYPLVCIIFGVSMVIFSKFNLFIDIIKSSNPVNVIFTGLIFILLFVPACKMDNGLTSETEERLLAKFPKLITADRKINSGFGKDFETWFNDRFWNRDGVISIYNNLVVRISNDLVKFSEVHFYKSNNMMFTNEDSRYQGIKSFTNKDLEKISSNTARLLDFCNKNDIKLYIMAVPSSEIINKNFDKALNNANSKNKVLPVLETLNKDLNFKIVYPKKELTGLEHAGKYPFFRTDLHPTDDGAYELYKIFINDNKKDFPNLEATPLSEYKHFKSNLVRAGFNRKFFDDGVYYRLSHINYKKLLQTEYDFYDYKYPDKIKIEQDGFNAVYTNNSASKYKLFLLGDSFIENMLPYLDTNFYKISKWRCNFTDMLPVRKSNLDMNVYEKEILKFKPDILMIVVYQSDIDWLLDMYPQKEEN